jgi:hypothetical protein
MLKVLRKIMNECLIVSARDFCLRPLYQRPSFLGNTLFDEGVRQIAVRSDSLQELLAPPPPKKNTIGCVIRRADCSAQGLRTI